MVIVTVVSAAEPGVCGSNNSGNGNRVTGGVVVVILLLLLLLLLMMFLLTPCIVLTNVPIMVFLLVLTTHNLNH